MITSADVVRALRGCEKVTSYLKPDKNGNLPIYQIVSPDANAYPHMAVFETSRSSSFYSDDVPTMDEIGFRINLYSLENNLHEISRAVRDCLRDAGFDNVNIGTDGWSIPLGLYTKTVSCSTWEQVEMEE